MGQYDSLTDVKVDLATGEVVIDSATNDAEIVRGIYVILQDAAIRLRTQLGQIQRQGLDDFGWDYYKRLKGDVAQRTIIEMSKEMERVVLLDSRITDCKVIPGQLIGESVEFNVTCEIDEEIASVTITI